MVVKSGFQDITKECTTRFYFRPSPFTISINDIGKTGERNVASSVFNFYFFISPLFNQVGKLRTSSHLQLRPGQDKAKQFDTIQQHRDTHGINKTYSQ